MALPNNPANYQQLMQLYQVYAQSNAGSPAAQDAYDAIVYALGGSHGGHRQATQALQVNPPQAAHPGITFRNITFKNNTFQGITLGEASSPEPIESAGIRAGEVEAFRVWRLDHGFLKSTFKETIWAPEEPMTGEFINDYHGNGVHAWKNLSKALEYAIQATGPHYGSLPIVFGRVHLWGEVVEHEHGYRAENAAIISIDGIIGVNNKRELIEGLRARYKVGGNDVMADDITIDLPPSEPAYRAGDVIWGSTISSERSSIPWFTIGVCAVAFTISAAYIILR